MTRTMAEVFGQIKKQGYPCIIPKKILIFAVHSSGEMLEWLKRHAWKACVPQKGIASSNLALSAKP